MRSIVQVRDTEIKDEYLDDKILGFTSDAIQEKLVGLINHTKERISKDLCVDESLIKHRTTMDFNTRELNVYFSVGGKPLETKS